MGSTALLTASMRRFGGRIHRIASSASVRLKSDLKLLCDMLRRAEVAARRREKRMTKKEDDLGLVADAIVASDAMGSDGKISARRQVSWVTDHRSSERPSGSRPSRLGSSRAATKTQ